MSEEIKNDNPNEEKNESFERIENQKKLVAELKDEQEKNPSEELSLRLKREIETLRYYKTVQKPNPLERVQTKANYAAKSAKSRAVQPVEKE